MKELAWLTDIHLNFLDSEQVSAFLATLAQTNCDAVLIGGDICEAPSLIHYLTKMEDHLQRPIYFVLGNHDYYHSSISEVRTLVATLSRKSPNLNWLAQTGVVELGKNTGIVGHSCWGDGGYGDFLSSAIRLNDYRLIRDLLSPSLEELLLKLRTLGENAAQHLRPVLEEGFSRYKKIFLLTHAPPFVEACWYQGKSYPAENEWIPHLTCKAVGDMLLEVMAGRPNSKLTVLSGHTHGRGEAIIRDNLTVLVGGAEYNRPEIQKIFKVE